MRGGVGGIGGGGVGEDEDKERQADLEEEEEEDFIDPRGKQSEKVSKQPYNNQQ